MADYYDLSLVKKALASAQSIPVFLPRKPSKDKVAAALGISLSLRKMGKRSSVICQEEMTVDLSWLVGVDKIGKEINGNNLLVSFDYVEDSIEKVSYNIEGGKFNLVIQPKEGFPPLSTEKIAYSYSGSQADLIFTVGSQSLNSLGEIYQKNRKLFEGDKVANLDNSAHNTRFGKFNLVNAQASSCSELVVGLLPRVGLPIDADIASNLLYGLEVSTRSFSSPNVGPGAFEAAAFCLRSGARKPASPSGRPASSRSSLGGPGRASTRGKGKKKISLTPMPTEVSAVHSPDLVEKSRPKDTGEKTQEKPSPDWFEPKVYQGGQRV